MRNDVHPSSSRFNASLDCAARSRVSSISRIRLCIGRRFALVLDEEPFCCGPYIRDSRACTRSSKNRADDAGVLIVVR